MTRNVFLTALSCVVLFVAATIACSRTVIREVIMTPAAPLAQSGTSPTSVAAVSAPPTVMPARPRHSAVDAMDAYDRQVPTGQRCEAARPDLGQVAVQSPPHFEATHRPHLGTTQNLDNVWVITCLIEKAGSPVTLEIGHCFYVLDDTLELLSGGYSTTFLDAGQCLADVPGTY